MLSEAYREISSDTKNFLARRKFGLLIDGHEMEAASGKTIETRDPSTGEVLGYIAAGSAEDVDRL
jgi:hypothetical protein